METIRMIILFLVLVFTQNELDLLVSIENINSSEGILKVCLFDSSETFLLKALECRDVEPPDSSAVKVIFDVQPGKYYAISAYHDLNANGRLDRNFLGIPKEPYGFSNNPSVRFGPPDFSETAFKIRKGLKISIRL